MILDSRSHIRRMADASGVHQLHKYLAAGSMHAVVYALPALHLFVREYAGDACITQAVRGWRCAFGDDQARVGTQL